MSVELSVNGHGVRVDPRPGQSLLDLLRGPVGLISIKRGCQPQGKCGACLALVDGEPRVTCTIPAERAQGMNVRTLEGLPAADLSIFAQAFQLTSGLQCGYCIPGIVLRAWHYLQTHPAPSRSEWAAALDEHICRCTGYVKILDALEWVARARAGEPLPEPCADGGVGASLQRYGGADMVLGRRPFVDDLARPGMLLGAVTLSRHARARVVGIDTTRARALPGVVAVVTAADVPGDRWNGLILNDWPGMVAVGEEVRCVGDVLAAVAAEDEATARAAAALVDVEYEPLPAVLDPKEALLDGAPQVNPRHANLLSHSVIRRGDADAALASSAHTATGTWKTQRIEHLFLETESALAVPLPNGRLHLYTHGQGVFDDRRQVARFLGEPEERIFVELVPSGGAFGGKEDLSIQAHAALLARVTGRPVKLTLSREESVRMHPKRHPVTIQLTAGCAADGRLTAVKARFIGDSGAYASVGMKVMERAAGHACGPYEVPHVDVESLAVYTNHPPCGAMRGFGVAQAAFALEGALDILACKAGLDPWEIRWRNAVEPGGMLTSGQRILKSVGIRRTLQAVKPGYDAARAQGRAVGIACALKNSGLGNGVREWGKARLVVEPDGTVSLYNGYTEMGQGLLTVLTQIAVEATGLPAAVFRPRVDATYSLDCGQTTGSRATLIGGRAVQAAGERLRAELDAGRKLDGLVGRVYAGDIQITDTTPLGTQQAEPKTHTSYGFATQVCILDPNGRVERILAAHDVGRAINPAMCQGQIEGAVHMGLGYALTEELPCRDGMPVTWKMRQLGVLRASDMPEVEVLLVEEPEPEGPYGAKGLGEIGLVPTAAAVAGALEAFDGIRRMTLPMKDSPAARAMSAGRIHSSIPKEEWR